MPTSTPRKAIIVGATSAIATALAERLIANNWNLVLVGRSRERISQLARHFQTKHGSSSARAAIGNSPKEIWEEERNGCELLVIATGALFGSPESTTPEETQETFEANTLLPIEWCQLATSKEAPMKFGTVCVIGSVAGDRGRASNHIYGAAKAAIETYCLGLAHRLAAEKKAAPFGFWSGPKICLIKPGFTRSAMTADLKDSPLMSSPEATAKSIYSAIKRGKLVAYCPHWWKWIMLIVKTLPHRILWKTKL